jgi:hypothetical protein
MWCFNLITTFVAPKIQATLTLLFLGLLSSHVHADPVNLDFSDLAQPFEGIGALSGGGGVTRLLIDYPPELQKDIYDILFEPKKGASLQFIKVEVGGDTQVRHVQLGSPLFTYFIIKYIVH